MLSCPACGGVPKPGRNGLDSKSRCRLIPGTWVRIPPPPPSFLRLAPPIPPALIQPVEPPPGWDSNPGAANAAPGDAVASRGARHATLANPTVPELERVRYQNGLSAYFSGEGTRAVQVAPPPVIPSAGGGAAPKRGGC